MNTMMLLLIHYIVPNHFLVTLTISKSSIAITPTIKHRKLITLNLHPFGCFYLQHLDEITNRNIRTYSDKHVEMVGSSPNTD